MKIISGWRSSNYLARFGIFLTIATLIVGIPVSYGVAGDDNHPSQNLEIYTWYDLDAVRDNLDGNHTLMNNLNYTTPGYEELASPTANQGKGWEPIGFVTNFTANGPDDNIPAPSIGCGQPAVAHEPIWRHGLTGTFDGRGYKICDLFINRPDESNVGLFRFVVNGYIENIDIMNATMIGKDRVGALVGSHHGIVINSFSTGNVTGNALVGGLVGYNSYTVSNSYSTGNVTGIFAVGGLVGFNDWGTVTNSYSSAYVTGEHGVGGLVGWNGWGTVTNSYSSAYVAGKHGVGGLVGRMDLGSVSNSYYNYNEVLINGENIITTGALFDGDFDEWLTNDKFLDINDRLSQENGYYVVNNIADFKELLAFGQNSSLKFRLKSDLNLATEPNLYIPYLAGEFDGNGHRISDLSLNLNPVSPLGLFGWLTPGGKITDLGVEDVNITGLDYVGGLVGRTRSGSLSRCYSTGSVTGDMYVGGLMGENMLGTISNSYSTSDITGRLLIGGLVGYNQGSVSSCYSTGTVNGEEEVGGLVGHSVTYSDVSNSFWNTETSGQPTSDGGTGKTTAEMKNIATFSGATWDIIAVANLGIRNPSYIWNIVNGVTYPFLSWQPVS
jgi:hypothetical protein